METGLEFGLGSYPPGPPPKRNFRSLAVSLALHIIGVSALAVLHLESVPPSFARTSAVTIVAPPLLDMRPYRPAVPKATRSQRPAAPAAAPEDIPLPPAARVVRAFDAPPPPVVRPSQLATLELPAAAIAVPVNPPLTTAHLPVLPAPPLKTDNPAVVERTNAAPVKGHIEAAAGFGTAGVAAAAPRVSADRAGSNAGLSTGGFSSSTTPAVASNVEAPRRAAASAGFGDATAVAPAASGARARTQADTPVEILEKLNPAYTDEARRLHLEGEVLLEILFPAAGPARVLRVVRGLGHGLDEQAVAAAQAIRFRPAKAGGVAVDSHAVVHVVFQITY
jgi:TonB family protein